MLDLDLEMLLRKCAPGIEQGLATRLIRKESGFNPYAIGMDGKAVLMAQPKSLPEAIAISRDLLGKKKTFSVGLAQIHIKNIQRLKLTWSQAFDPCLNIKHGESILRAFHNKALREGLSGNAAVLAALRGYNSGNLFAKVSADYAHTIATGQKMQMTDKTSLSSVNFVKRKTETFDSVGEFFTTDTGKD